MKMAMILCAKDAVIDRGSNSVSIFNIFDDITAPAFPVFLTPFCVISILERDRRETDSQTFNLRIKIADQEIFSQEMNIAFQGKLRVRNIVQFSGLPLVKPGLFEVAAYKGPQLLGRYWFTVAQAGPIEAQPKESFSQEHSAVFFSPGSSKKTKTNAKGHAKRTLPKS